MIISYMRTVGSLLTSFFFNDTATTEIYTLSLHDALPIFLLDENRFKSGSSALRLAVSILLHVTVITVPILIGLVFTDTINIKQYAAAMLVAPPPPPPPPAIFCFIRAAPARTSFLTSRNLLPT